MVRQVLHRNRDVDGYGVCYDFRMNLCGAHPFSHTRQGSVGYSVATIALVWFFAAAGAPATAFAASSGPTVPLDVLDAFARVLQSVSAVISSPEPLAVDSSQHTAATASGSVLGAAAVKASSGSFDTLSVANDNFTILQNGNVGLGTTTPDTILKIATSGALTNTRPNLHVQSLVNGATPGIWFNSWHPGAGPPGNFNAEAITGAIDVPATATVHESAGIAGYVRSQKSFSYGSDVGGFFQAEAAANGTSVAGIDSECVVGAGLTSAYCQNIFRTRIYSPGVTAIGLNVMLDGKTAPSASYGLAVQARNASTTWGTAFVSPAGAATTGIELGGVTKGNNVDSQPIKLTGTNASGATKSATFYANKNGELFVQPQSLTSFTGRVGIGTSAPVVPLHVIGNNGTGAIAAFQTSATSSYVVIGNGLGKAVVQGVSTKGKEDALVFNPQGVGSVGIGTTTPTAQLHTTGTVRFSKLGAGTLTTDANGNISVSSDERLKNIQGAFVSGLSAIMQIDPILYHWKPETGYDVSTTYAGFSAQNVQAAIPEAVGSSASGYLTLQDRPLVAATINAIKELSAKLDMQSSAVSGFAERVVTQILAADRIETHELCAQTSDGSKVCITGDQLAALLRADSGSQGINP